MDHFTGNGGSPVTEKIGKYLKTKKENDTVDEGIKKDMEFLSTFKDATGEVERLMKTITAKMAIISAKVDDPDKALKDIDKFIKKTVSGSKLDSKMKQFMTNLYKHLKDETL